MILDYKTTVAGLPPEYDRDLPIFNLAGKKSIVILDDDPTGCQTVSNVPVLTCWDVKIIKRLFAAKTPLFFILINTRSMDESAAVSLNREVVINLKQAAGETGRDFLVVSRSDSTLRGHFPAETDTIIKNLGMHNALPCLIPAFFQGGRFTIEDIHYVLEGDKLIPAADTSYAADKVFGFKSSGMYDYIREKTGGNLKKEDILSISIEDLRARGPEFARDRLLDSQYKACFVNAFSQRDLDVFAAGAIMASEKGKEIIFRTAASFINSIGGIPQRDLLRKEDLVLKNNRGALFIVGSYVDKTTLQLKHLLDQENVVPFEIRVDCLMAGSMKSVIDDLADKASRAIQRGQNPVLYTSRRLIAGTGKRENLGIGKRISDSIVEIMRAITVEPSFILTKGGITSHVTATGGLGIKEAVVLGQVLPGVPVWKTKEGDRFINTPLIIFPGNVGTGTSLAEIYQSLT